MNTSNQDPIILTTNSSQYSVAPGDTLEIPVILANQGSTQNQLRISVEGIPMVWVSTEHQVVLLQPGEQRQIILKIQSSCIAECSDWSIYAKTASNQRDRPFPDNTEADYIDGGRIRSQRSCRRLGWRCSICCDSGRKIGDPGCDDQPGIGCRYFSAGYSRFARELDICPRSGITIATRRNERSCTDHCNLHATQAHVRADILFISRFPARKRLIKMSTSTVP